MSGLAAYWPCLAGGALIGSSAAVLLLADGRVAGVSGIVAHLFRPGEGAWRPAFVAGLVTGPLCLAVLLGHPPRVEVAASYPLLLVAGLLVGFGTRLGSGCTSGHGVCGLARPSPRSFVAVVAFMASAIATVFLVRHGIGA